MKSKIDEAIKTAHIIAVGGHIRPDGDCVGSCCAIYHYIKKLYPKKEVFVYFDKTPDIFDFLTKKVEAVYDYKDVEADLFIALDVSEVNRLGDARVYFEKAGNTICIDHHISNKGFACINNIYPDSSSTCEVLYELFEPDKVDYNTAEALYTGIIHDTGVLRYSSVSKRTLEISGILKETGIEADKIIAKSFYEKTFVQNRLLGKCLLDSRLLLSGAFIVSVITPEIFEEFEATAEDTEGIVSQLRDTRGVKVAALLYALGENEYKVSLRSGEDVDVRSICEKFGGGGHVAAAGCTIYASDKEAVKQLTEAVKTQLELSEKD